MTKVTNTTEFYGVCAAPMDLSEANLDRRFSVFTMIQEMKKERLLSELHEVHNLQIEFMDYVVNLIVTGELDDVASLHADLCNGLYDHRINSEYYVGAVRALEARMRKMMETVEVVDVSRYQERVREAMANMFIRRSAEK